MKFKNYTRKIKLPFMIYADFECILVPQNNENKKPVESYTKKYQNHVGFSSGYKLPYVNNDQFSKYFKSYLAYDAVHTFITNLAEESKCCCRVMKKHFNKELVMTKE